MLAGLAGTADSIGFLEFSQLFMSFMSGNTTRFGVAVSSYDWGGTTRFASVIAIFCFGAFLGTLIAAWSGRWRLSVLLIIQAILFAIGLYVPFGTDAFPLHAYPIVLALGIQNATLQDEAGRSLALTYVTGTVVRFGAGVANILLHKPAPSFWIQAPLWGRSARCVLGGFLHHWFDEKAFLFPAGFAALLAVVSLVLSIVLKDTPYVSAGRRRSPTPTRRRSPPRRSRRADRPRSYRCRPGRRAAA